MSGYRLSVLSTDFFRPNLFAGRLSGSLGIRSRGRDRAGRVDQPGALLKVLELAGTDVEQGLDALGVDVEAVGDQLVIGPESSQTEPDAIRRGNSSARDSSISSC